MTLINSGQFLQSVLNQHYRSAQTLSQGLKISTMFDARLFLHELAMVSSQASHKAMKVKIPYKTGSFVVLVVQNEGWAWCRQS